ncbi:MAG: hypothetical protein KDD70_11845 [Bdellovibrionales bacterium]|nr:hypothetical protein [Bdellovibrionales bacterium]
MELQTRFERGEDDYSPLHLFVHGKAGNLDIMRIFTRVIPTTAHKLFVEAPYPDKRGGFSWWDTDTEVFPKEQFEQAQTALVETIVRFRDQERLNALPIAALGFSQGSGILTSLQLGGRYQFEKIAILAGFVKWPEGDPVVTPKTKFFWGHGEQDEVVSIARAERDVRRLLELGYQVDFVKDPVGHKVGSSAMRSLKSFFETVDY